MAFAFGIIVAGLAGRALIDKMLAARGGGEAVALWAQLQSLIEMVVGVVSIGIGQGITVLVAQQADGEHRRALMRAALLLGGMLSALVAVVLLILVFAGAVAAWLPVEPRLAALAVATGWLSIAAAVLTAVWLGQHRPDRVFWLSGGMLLFPLVAAVAWTTLWPMLFAEALAAGLVALLLAAALRRRRNERLAERDGDLSSTGSGGGDARGALSGRLLSLATDGPGRSLIAYVPVGLAIGLASPIALILIRGEVSAALSWHDAGLIQALWRSSDWVTATMSGLLAYLVLPRLSTALTAGRAVFRAALRGAAIRVLAPTAVLLFLLWLNQRAVLVALYDERFTVAAAVAGVFYAGDLLRVASWVILFALLALRATVWVTVGEFLSLPLFSALVLLFSHGMSIERAAGLYFLTYAVYLAFNLLGLRFALKGQG